MEKRHANTWAYDAKLDLFGPKGGWCRNCLKAMRGMDCGGRGRMIVARVKEGGRVHIARLSFYSYEDRRVDRTTDSLCYRVKIELV